MFLNLSQTEGAAVIISVSTFIERIAELGRAEAGYGQAGKDARKLLARRGLTPKVIDEAKALLDQVTTLEEAPAELPDLEEERTRLAQAEEAMWAWYLEWAEIARAAIKDRALLRRLGFLATASRGRSAVAEDGDDEPGGGGSPSPTPSAV